MISRRAKALFYSAMSVPMWVNGRIYRSFRQSDQPLKVHLGCGQQNYLRGWLNVDANLISAKIDLWANLLDGLPFRENSVERFYSFHVIEHLPDSFLQEHFHQMFKALRPGGAIRVGGPNIDNACLKFLENDSAWFSDFPDRRDSIGGRFVNFLFCRNEHLTALTRSYLCELANNAGFTAIQFCVPVRQSAYFNDDVLGIEHESDYEFPHSILLEARKPE